MKIVNTPMVKMIYDLLRNERAVSFCPDNDKNKTQQMNTGNHEIKNTVPNLKEVFPVQQITFLY